MKRYLYLHGFASGPSSYKGVAFAEHYAPKGIAIERLNLRVPSFEHLRLSQMITTAQAALGAPVDTAIVFGSSLGALTAARVAANDPRIEKLVLLAPAFDLIARWRDMLGPALETWRETGFREYMDYTTKQMARVDYGFMEDAIAVEAEGAPDVRVPMLIIAGTKDETVPIEHVRRFARGRDNVELIELDDGHKLIASLPRILVESDRFLGL
ncbi:MAG: alpha/beta hydrolase [Kofleriaceae bacterium]